MQPDPLGPPAGGSQEAAQQEPASQCNLRQPLCHITYRDHIDYEIKLSLKARFDRAALELESKFLHSQSGRRVSRPALPYQPRRNHASVRRALGRIRQVDAACSDAAFLASSFSTIFIIGEGEVSAFLVPTVRWRRTASL